MISFLLCLFFVFNLHSRSTFQDYHSPLWADSAGYFIYLPATFEYGFDATAVNDSLPHMTGEGFSLDEGKIRTKYTYGVALLNLPGYLIADALGGEIDETIDPKYHYAVLLTALTLVFLALYCLEFTLSQYINRKMLVLLIPLLLFGTNLFYYTVHSGGMSHAYLFSLLTFAWYGIEKYYRGCDFKFWVLFVLCFALAIVIRPTSILALPIFIALNPNRTSFTDKLKYWSGNWKLLITTLIIPAVLILPQMLYWKYAYGDWVAYSYGNEGFTNWDAPYLLSVLFNPLNGWIPYTPIALVMLIGLMYMIRERFSIGVGMGVTFVLIWYAFSSWWIWYFGCSLGGRSFVDYYGFLALPMLFVLEKLFLRRRLVAKLLIGACFFVLICVNIKLTYTYDDCFYGKPWEWQAYFDELSK